MRTWSLATVIVLALSGAVAPALARDAAKATEPADAVPAWLEAKISGLTPQQREFLLSDEADGFAGSHKKLLQRLETKSPEEIAAYVEGMMAVAKAQKFNEATDMAAIPLNTEASDFNLWKLRRPESFGARRNPGPISLSYYASGRPGIRTFANAPVAIYPEDLVAGKVDVAIVGAPLDMGS